MNDAYRENVEGQGAPPVYHPHGGMAAPSYDEYADPAIAHGWQNTYDDTVRIAPTEDVEDTGGADLPDDVGRHERLMRRRRVRTKRRGAVAAGVAGALILTVVISGLFGSESSEKEDQEAPKAPQSSSATDGPGPTASLADDPSGAPPKASDGPSSEARDKASVSPSPSDSRSPGSGDSGEPTTGTPSTTAAPTREPGKGNDNPGRGQGVTKHPK